MVNPRALVTQNGKFLAYVVKGQQVQVVPVQTGAKLGDWVEVLAGLQEGDKIVLQPSPSLKSGDRVKVLES